jgi:hypothetical protein
MSSKTRASDNRGVIQMRHARADQRERVGTLRQVVASTAYQARLDAAGPMTSELAVPTSRGLIRLKLDLSTADGDRLLASFPMLAGLVRAEPAEYDDDESIRPLSAHEVAVLREGGLMVGEGAPPSRVRGPGAYEELLRSSLSTPDAAVRLGLTDARVRQRIRERSLFAVRHGRSWKLPAVQFTDDGLVPGIEQVIAAIPADMSPVAAVGFLTTPQPELARAGHVLTPRDWLCETGDPLPVLRLARDL